MSMSDPDYIAQLAALKTQGRRFARLNRLLVALLGLWIFAGVLYVPLKRVGATLYQGAEVGSALLAVGDALAPAAPAVALLIGLWTAGGLFQRFAAGEPFAAENGAALARLGTWLLVAAAVAFLLGGAVFLVGMAPALAVAGLMLRMVGSALGMAARLKADHDGIL